MPTYIYLHHSPSLRLWGLTYSQRIQRQFQRDSQIRWVEHLSELPAAADVLVVDGRWLLDGRILQALVKSGQGRFYARAANRVVAVRCQGQQIEQALSCIDGIEAAYPWPQEVLEDSVNTLEARLRKLDPPLILALTEENRRAIENALYGSAYKSVTDLITKWAWPRPARQVTRWCAYAGLRPNHITLLGLILMLAAGVLFYFGEFGWGLLAGWIMTFLDTVDGKLARVTLTASKLGNALDHGMDLVHPPFWYMLWGMGLGHLGLWAGEPSLTWIYGLIFAGYIGGRLAEGCFEWIIGSFSLFTWRPFDSFNRLVTARRNPCMIILTAAWALQRPDLGLLGVVLWTLFSTALLWLRNAQAALARRRGPLESWLELAGRGQSFSRLALRTFAPHLLGKSA